MMSRVGGQGTLHRHLIHYILPGPFYKRALCWSGAGALGGDSSLQNSWKDRWMEADGRGGTGGDEAGSSPANVLYSRLCTTWWEYSCVLIVFKLQQDTLYVSIWWIISTMSEYFLYSKALSLWRSTQINCSSSFSCFLFLCFIPLNRSTQQQVNQSV